MQVIIRVEMRWQSLDRQKVVGPKEDLGLKDLVKSTLLKYLNGFRTLVSSAP